MLQNRREKRRIQSPSTKVPNLLMKYSFSELHPCQGWLRPFDFPWRGKGAHFTPDKLKIKNYVQTINCTNDGAYSTDPAPDGKGSIFLFVFRTEDRTGASDDPYSGTLLFRGRLGGDRCTLQGTLHLLQPYAAGICGPAIHPPGFSAADHCRGNRPVHTGESITETSFGRA